MRGKVCERHVPLRLHGSGIAEGYWRVIALAGMPASLTLMGLDETAATLVLQFAQSAACYHSARHLASTCLAYRPPTQPACQPN